MVEIACECEEGLGYPHSHVKVTTVRNELSGEELHMTGYVVPDQGQQWKFVEAHDELRFWGDQVSVAADDLQAVLETHDGVDLAEGQLERLQEALASSPRPTKEERAELAKKGLLR